MYDLIIIGLGPAGINAALYAKRSNLNILVIEKGIPGGTLNSIKTVENYLGYEQINGSDLAIQFYKQFKSLNIQMNNEEVIDIKVNGNEKKVVTNKSEYTTKAIIISTGRGPLKLDLPNNDLPGISYCALCDGSLYKGLDIAFYGNNPRALEDVIYLSGIVKNLYLITPIGRLNGPKDLIDKINNLSNVTFCLGEEITSIDGTNKITSITTTRGNYPVSGLFINNEYGPITYFCKNIDILDDKGYILVGDKQNTKIDGIFACGDSTKKEIYQIITAASEGASAAINAYKYIKDIK